MPRREESQVWATLGISSCLSYEQTNESFNHPGNENPELREGARLGAGGWSHTRATWNKEISMRKRKKAEQNPRFSFFGYETIKHILSIQQSGPAVRQRVHMLSHFSRVQLSVTLRTTAPHSSVMGFSRQEYWDGLPCPPPGDLADPGIKPASYVSCTGRWVLYHQRHRGNPKSGRAGSDSYLCHFLAGLPWVSYITSLTQSPYLQNGENKSIH